MPKKAANKNAESDVFVMPYEKGGVTTADDIAEQLFQPEVENDASDDEGPEDEEGTAERDSPEPSAELEAEAESDESDVDEDKDTESGEPGEPEAYELEDDTLIRLGDETVNFRELRDGRLRQSDYTRKTQQLAEQRKTLEAELEQLSAQRAQYAEGLAAIEQQLSGGEKEPDWDKIQAEKPHEFPTRYANYQRRKESLKAVQEERTRVKTQQETEEKTKLQERLVQERERLIEKVPEWSDADRYQTAAGQIAEHARSVGFTDDELAELRDHRLMIVLRNSNEYTKIKSSGKTIRAKAKTAPKLKPGASTNRLTPGKNGKLNRQMDTLKQTGRPTDAAAVIESLLEAEERR